MPKMTDEEVRAFLDEPGHLVRIATVDEDGWPRVAQSDRAGDGAPGFCS